MCDISMPEMNGLETTRRVLKEFPNVRVIMLSMHTSEEYVWQALRAGATGYLIKDTNPAELDPAIKSALAGMTYLTPNVSKQVVNSCMQRLETDATIPVTQTGDSSLRLIDWVEPILRASGYS